MLICLKPFMLRGSQAQKVYEFSQHHHDMSDLTVQNLSIPERSAHVNFVGFRMQLIIKVNFVDKYLL